MDIRWSMFIVNYFINSLIFNHFKETVIIGDLRYPQIKNGTRRNMSQKCNLIMTGDGIFTQNENGKRQNISPKYKCRWLNKPSTYRYNYAGEIVSIMIKKIDMLHCYLGGESSRAVWFTTRK